MKTVSTACFLVVFLILAACTTAPVSTTVPTTVPATDTTAPPTETTAPTEIPTQPVSTATAAPTPLPYHWEQIYNGKAFPRDTVTAIVVDPTNAEVLYVGTGNSGVYKSSDGGKNWQPASAGLDNVEVAALVLDPQNPATLYVALAGAGVYKTTDGGQNWKSINGVLPFSTGSKLLIDPQNPQNLYYSEWEGLFASKDGGETWKRVYQDVIIDLALDPNTSDLYVTREEAGGAYRSGDGGQTWEKFAPPDFKKHPNAESRVWVGGDAGGTTVFITGGNAEGHHILYSTTDGGKTWLSYITVKWTSCNAMAFGPQAMHTAFCSFESGQIIQFNTADATWSYLPRAGENPIHSILFVPEKNLLLAGTSGLYALPYGGSKWATLNNGFGAPELEFLIFPNPGELFLKAINSRNDYSWLRQGQIYRSKDNGRSWAFYAWDNIAVDADGKTLYKSEAEKRFLRSRDAGITWAELPNPRPNEWAKLKIFPSPHQPGYLLAVHTSKGLPLYISTDWGSNWQAANRLMDCDNVRVLFDPSGSDLVYAVTDCRIIYSLNGGQEWPSCGMVNQAVASTASTLAIDPRDNQHLLLATVSGILVSKDGCQNWEFASAGLENYNINTIAFDPQDPNIVYAGTDSGAYISIDAGQRWPIWQPLNSGLPEPAVVYSIFVDDQSNVFAATPFGIYQLKKE